MLRALVILIVATSCTATQRNRSCIGQSTSPSELCIGLYSSADGATCAFITYGLTKTDEAAVKWENKKAEERSKSSLVGGLQSTGATK